MRELLAAKSKSCMSCSVRNRMLALSEEKRVRMAEVASRKAAEVAAKRKDPLVERFGREVVTQIRILMQQAKGRCTNKNEAAYVNYGGRGIRFLFPNTRSAVEWVLNNLGPKPTPTHSIDRIDNNRHYEPGNLRWATRVEQSRNKRAYKRTEIGERIRRLQKFRVDVTYETLRVWIKKGATDDEILQRRKHDGCGIRHKKLRTPA